ncbi:putative zinc-binding oxidoreductase ToxD [Lophiostoma macrostomum CBS 122681]|uniref:Putative zinc-binding oxidoreductase ToxD n=1 Tax=Lophiostoma macrostomum CBS 122681 TaxID=1314788 RepID=A0A6A6SR07_9PLEO|nr:putative zinc-binding oxidoreductase ToxD [Lophiostoma macrostomum CBS 122681]
MKAVIIKEHGIAAVADIPEQNMQPDYVKVRTVALAMNPTDLHHTSGAGRVGGIIGCDLAGIVEEVGKDCKTDVKKGDAVYGVAHCANLSADFDGAFAEFALVRDGFLARKPERLSFEEVSTLGVGITAAAQALYMNLGLPLPGEKPAEQPLLILIYGGSSATGTLAIQYAKLSGLNVVTTASPENFDLVKSRGADVVFDYHDPECAQKIKDYTQNSLHLVLDCISTEASYKLIAQALPDKNEQPMKVIALLPTDTWPRKDVEATAILAYTQLGKPFTKFGIDFPAFPDHYDFGVKSWKLSNELLSAGKLVPHPVAFRSGGLAGIPNGLAEHAAGKVKGVKLVYRVSDVSAGSQHESVVQAPKLGSQW